MSPDDVPLRANCASCFDTPEVNSPSENHGGIFFREKIRAQQPLTYAVRKDSRIKQSVTKLGEAVCLLRKLRAQRACYQRLHSFSTYWTAIAPCRRRLFHWQSTPGFNECRGAGPSWCLASVPCVRYTLFQLKGKFKPHHDMCIGKLLCKPLKNSFCLHEQRVPRATPPPREAEGLL